MGRQYYINLKTMDLDLKQHSALMEIRSLINFNIQNALIFYQPCQIDKYLKNRVTFFPCFGI